MTSYCPPDLLFASIAADDEHACRANLARGASVHALDQNGYSVLHRLALKGGLNAVAVGNVLIEYGAQLDVKDKLNFAPLHWAAQLNHLEVCKFLVEQGATLELRTGNISSHTPLGRAAEHGCYEVFAYLVEMGADFDAIAEDGMHKDTPFQIAVKMGFVDIIRFCAQRGADLAQRTAEGKTLLQLAGKNAEVKTLLRQLRTERAVTAGLDEAKSDLLAGRRKSIGPAAL